MTDQVNGHVESQAEHYERPIQVSLQPKAWRKQIYGGFWMRLWAYLVDLFFANVMTNILLNLTVYRILGTEASSLWWIGLIRMMVIFSYFVGTNLIFDGQTCGKILFNLRIRTEEGQPLDLQRIVFREGFGKIIIYYAPILALILVFTDKRQHPIDLLCDTVVVKDDVVEDFRLE